MSDWNPSLYLHFSAERSRPAVELLARVPLENVEYVADLWGSDQFWAEFVQPGRTCKPCVARGVVI